MHVKGCSHFFVVVKITSTQTVQMYIHKDFDCRTLLFFLSISKEDGLVLHVWHTKPNLPDQTFQTKSTKPNLPDQTCQTKPKLLVKAVNAWVHSAFDNIS